MSTAQDLIDWLKRHEGTHTMPADICPVLGKAIYDWHDALGNEDYREEFIYPLCAALATSKDDTKIAARRLAFATWLRDVAWPTWLSYADLREGEELDDVFAEHVARNQGNGIASVNSYLMQTGVTPAAWAAANVELQRTKDRNYYRERLKTVVPKVEVANLGGSVEQVSPQKLASRCFRAAFCQPADPTRKIEYLQESFLTLLQGLLGLA